MGGDISLVTSGLCIPECNVDELANSDQITKRYTAIITIVITM